jgi:hypothetical protein
VLVAPSLTAAVRMLSAEPYAASVAAIFVIGGAAAFAEVLAPDSAVPCSAVHLTRVFKDLDCDVFIPPLDDARYVLTACTVSTAWKASQVLLSLVKGMPCPRPPTLPSRCHHETRAFLTSMPVLLLPLAHSGVSGWAELVCERQCPPSHYGFSSHR